MEVPVFFAGGYFGATEQKAGEQFAIDELLNFSNDDAMITADVGFFDSVAGNSADSSTATVVDSCNSSVSGGDHHFAAHRSFADAHFSGDLCVPVTTSLANWISQLNMLT